MFDRPQQANIDRLRLARTQGVGPTTYRRLLARFGTAAASLDALPDITRRAGRPVPPTVPALAEAEREMAALAQLGGRMLFLGTPDYPPLLALMGDAPPVLSILGDSDILHRPAVAMVGSRNASANGMKFADFLAEDLAGNALVVISGLARGIDAAAHRGALRAGATVACVAGGLDRPYPAENAALQAQIAAAGVVVAEAPFGTTPQARHFPRRNRIIAGLSLGVVVVEAALRSGSLITARIAQEEGRELFAVPGSPLDPRCHGSNSLLREGAHITETAADVRANLPDHPRREGLSRDPLFARIPASDGLAEPQIALEASAGAVETLLELLGPAPTAVDDLVRRCQFSAPEVRAALLDLELAGRVETLPGSRVALLVQGL
jgi:DNA processing protein